MEGINRLAKMLEGQKDKYLNIIVNHLMQHVELDQAFLNEEKNLKDMAEYIKGKARKEASGNVAVIEDSVVFDWAKEYFNKSNEELGIKKQADKTMKNTTKENNKENDEFGSIFDFESNENTEKEKNEQISLFSV